MNYSLLRGIGISATILGLVFGANAAFASAATISVNPSSGISGSSVTVSGTGYNPGESVSIWFGASRTTTTSSASAYANQSGYFTIPMTVPWEQGGTTSLTAQGNSSGVSASSAFYINGTNQSPTGSLSLSQYSGTPGTGVTIYGSAFPRNSVITIYFGGTVAGSVTSDGNGAFQAFVSVPNLPTGLVNVTATGAVTSNPPTFYVNSGTTQAGASITLNPTSGAQGTQVSVTGSGFFSGEIVNVSYGGLSSAVVTNNVGAFTFSFQAPFMNSNQSMNITAVGQSSGRSASALFTSTTNPPIGNASISLSPSSGPVDTIVTMTGSGFLSGESINVQFGSLSSVITSVDGNGFFNVNFRAPYVGNAQNVTVTAVGRSSGRTAYATFFETTTITPPPTPTPDIAALQAQIAALQEQIRQLIALINQLLSGHYWR